MPKEPKKLTLTPGTDAETRLKRFLKDNVRSIREGLSDIHTHRLVQWRKGYEAVPAEETREFPWHNASNLVVPLIAIHSDTLLARVMAAIFKTKPLWTARLIGEHPGVTDLSKAAEEFLQYVGMEPDELDLYRVYHEWCGETIRYGTSTVKSPWFVEFEDAFGPSGDMSGKEVWRRNTNYAGPRPEKLAFENFGIPPAARTVKDAKFKYDKIKLSKYDLEERRHRNIYDRAAVDIVMNQPDRRSPDYVQSQKEQDAGAKTVQGYGYAEWDIYECHFKYRIDETHFVRLIVWYHEKSDTILRGVYFYYPDEIFVTARLFFRDDMFHGYGFAEMLANLQEEVSQIHNGRRDNQTVCNMKGFWADPDSKLHKGFRLFPSVIVPGRKDEQGTLEFGTPVQGEIDSERLTLELSEKRSGVSPPMQGMGAGANTKRGVYTAMGTLSLMQEGNTRTDLNVTDMRYAHTRLGRLLCKEYAEFGSESDFHAKRLEMFGEMGAKIGEAMEAIKDGRLAIPVYASTASVNREVEKQSDLMLMGMMTRYYQMMAQMLQQADNPMITQAMPRIKSFLEDAMQSAEYLSKLVMKHFGYDEVDRLVPGVKPATATAPSPGAPGPGMGAPPVGGPAAGTAPSTGGQSSGGAGQVLPPMPQVVPPGTLQ